jgi:hypothetical protein
MAFFIIVLCRKPSIFSKMHPTRTGDIDSKAILPKSSRAVSGERVVGETIGEVNALAGHRRDVAARHHLHGLDQLGARRMARSGDDLRGDRPQETYYWRIARRWR